MGCGCCGHKYRQTPRPNAQTLATRRPRTWSFKRPQGATTPENKVVTGTPPIEKKDN